MHFLPRTFQLTKGVGPWRERDLWARDIETWDDFEKAAGQEHLFTEVNRILTDGGRTAVDWSLEAP